MERKIVLITGATSGFGWATAIKFAEHNYNVIITGRRQERLEELEQIIKNTYEVNVLTLQFDIRKKEEVNSAIGSIPHAWKNIDVLVNNAGLALGLSTIQEGDINDWEIMIDTNIKGLLYISRGIMPGMVERNSGHIINIGSVAGKEAYGKGNVYCATKFAVDALTKSMRIDLLPHNIKVTSICPGLAETEFSLVRFKGDAERAKVPYANFEALTAEDIADVVYFTASRPAHVCLNDIVITPTAQANAHDSFRKPVDNSK
ncbi:MAG: SDR family oxidoreductase [Bacteroidota bacterium]